MRERERDTWFLAVTFLFFASLGFVLGGERGVHFLCVLLMLPSPLGLLLDLV